MVTPEAADYESKKLSVLLTQSALIGFPAVPPDETKVFTFRMVVPLLFGLRSKVRGIAPTGLEPLSPSGKVATAHQLSS